MSIGKSSRVVSCSLPGKDAVLGVVVNRAYRIVPGGRATPIADEVEVSADPVYVPSSNEGARERFVADAALMELGKPLTDVVLFGHAYAPNGKGATSSVDTGLELGAARKAVRAIGQRRIELKGKELAFSAPESFERMPITSDLAYGGRDVYSEKLLYADPKQKRLGRSREMKLTPQFQLSYPRNPSGRGYFLDVERERLHGELAPCLEDPTDPVSADRLLSERTTEWIDRPVAACFEPIDIVTFPRAAFFIKPVYDEPARKVHELSTGAVLHEDLARPFDMTAPRNPRVYNMAPSGLAVCRLHGGERARLWNLHSEHAHLEFDLPDDEPRLAIDVPGVGERRVDAQLGTVRIEPDLNRVVLTWSGFLQVAAIYPEELTATIRGFAVWRRSGASG